MWFPQDELAEPARSSFAWKLDGIVDRVGLPARAARWPMPVSGGLLAVVLVALLTLRLIVSA